MLVPCRGMAVNVGEQTGDGRFIVPGAVTWTGDGPWPLAWLVDGDQHADMTSVCPQIGLMTALLPVRNGVLFTGVIDDEVPVGAEAVRRMQAGSATLGSRFAVSLDPDDWAYQLVDMQPEAEEDDGMVLLYASGSVRDGERFDWNQPLRTIVASGMVAPERLSVRQRFHLGMLSDEEQHRLHDALLAAAGEGDPLSSGGRVFWEDSADSMIARFTRLRVRGLTCCAVAAFAGCYLELDEAGAGFAGMAETGPTALSTTQGSSSSSSANNGASSVSITVNAGGETTTMEPVIASIRVGVNLAEPPRSWFADPELDGPTPFTVTADRRYFGHIAAWQTCHTGYTDRCVPPPHGTYERFMVGATLCSDGSEVRTGVFAWGIPHAGLTLPLIEAWEHYANSRFGFGRGVAGEDRHGIWCSGALFPHVTDDDVAVLRALSMSGDWRRDPQTRRLSLVASLAVNYPGYPIPRENAVTAAGGEVIDVESWETPDAMVHMDGEEIVALVACGRIAPRARYANDCGCDGPNPALAALEQRIVRMERLQAVQLPSILETLDGRVGSS